MSMNRGSSLMVCEATALKASLQSVFYLPRDLVEEELRHQPVGDEPNPVLVHFRQQLLAVRVDEAHVGEVDQRRQRRFSGEGAEPALLQFTDTRAGEFSFNDEAEVSGDVASGNA